MSDVIGVPDFSRMQKGTRSGRLNVSQLEFEALVKRVEELERIIREARPKRAV